MKTLQEVRNYLADINYISNGGCGIAAYAMYLWLKKNDQLTDDFKFVFLYNGWGDEEYYENNLRVLKNRDGIPVAASHIGIFHNGIHMDCESEIKLTRYKHIQFIEDEEFLVNALKSNSWNHLFDRDKQIPIIEKALDIDL